MSFWNTHLSLILWAWWALCFYSPWPRETCPCQYFSKNLPNNLLCYWKGIIEINNCKNPKTGHHSWSSPIVEMVLPVAHPMELYPNPVCPTFHCPCPTIWDQTVGLTRNDKPVLPWMLLYPMDSFNSNWFSLFTNSNISCLLMQTRVIKIPL